MTVGCSASAGCVAGDSSNNVVALVSGAWTATSITGPVPGGSSSYQWDISGIACTALCYPVGAENMGGDPGNFSQAAVVASGSGTDWTARLAPLPGNAEPRTGTDQRAYVNGVACRSSQCTAAGSYIDTSGHEQALLLAHSGTRWTAAESPLPTGAASVPEARLDAVACPSTTSCVVVGTYNDSISGRAQGLIDSGAGRVFTPTEAPLPSGGGQRRGPDWCRLRLHHGLLGRRPPSSRVARRTESCSPGRAPVGRLPRRRARGTALLTARQPGPWPAPPRQPASPWAST